jgi:hypothetical protein
VNTGNAWLKTTSCATDPDLSVDEDGTIIEHEDARPRPRD